MLAKADARTKGTRHTISRTSPIDGLITTNITDNVIAVNVGQGIRCRRNTDAGPSSLSDAVDDDLGDKMMSNGLGDHEHHDQGHEDEELELHHRGTEDARGRKRDNG